MSVSREIPFLMYHCVAPTPVASNVPGHYVHPSRFAAHLLMLKRKGFQTISLRDAVNVWGGSFSPTGQPIVLTFDDGYEHWNHYALPMLLQEQMTATLFVVAGRIGGTNLWDNQQGDVVESIASEEMVRNWCENKFEIGSHSMTHANLPQIDPVTRELEFVESKRVLEDTIGRSVDWFCYPYGAQNEAVKKAAIQAGYHGACSTRKGLNDENTDPFLWRRINVRSDTWTPILYWKIIRERKRHQSVP